MNTTAEQVRQALIGFDRDLRNTSEWSNWVENQNYKYAIYDDDKIYPVKQIVSMATGLPRTEFSGGDQSNGMLSGLGFKIISIRAASWAVKSGQEAVKILDKSAFTQGTGIPIEIRPFFINKDIGEGEHRQLRLTVNGKKFSAYIAVESSPTKRTRLFWGRDIINELAQRFPIHYMYAQEDKEFDELPPAEMTFIRDSGFDQYSVSLKEGEPKGKEWSDEELEETVKAYLWMLEQESQGKSYSKSGLNNRLREGKLNRRTKASIEYRMQNISSVLEDHCMSRIKGYLPAKNVGANTKVKIAEMLERLGAYTSEDYKPSDSQEILDKRVSKILKKGIKGTPKGQEAPAQTTTTSTTYARDPLVKAWVLDNAKGICEGCGSPAPFLKSDGEPFLEVHHVIMLADGGVDKIENTVALCPNCHRRCHISKDKETYSTSLYLKVNRLMRKI